MEQVFENGFDNKGFCHEENVTKRELGGEINTESIDHYEQDISDCCKECDEEISDFLGHEDDKCFEMLFSNDKIVVENDVENEEGMHTEKRRDFQCQNDIIINVDEDKVDEKCQMQEAINGHIDNWDKVNNVDAESTSKRETFEKYIDEDNNLDNESILDENYNSLTILTPSIKSALCTEIRSLISAKFHLISKQKTSVFWLSITLSGLLLSLHMVRFFFVKLQSDLRVLGGILSK